MKLMDAIDRSGVMLKCRECKGLFSIHRSCYRNQKYCSKTCRKLQRSHRQKKSAKRYRSTKAAKLLQSRRQSRYRKRHRHKNKVTHHTSPVTPVNVLPNWQNNVSLQTCIVCCGEISSFYRNILHMRRHRDYRRRKTGDPPDVFSR